MHSSNSNFAEDLALAGQGVKIFYKSNSRATQFWSPPSVEGRPPPFLQKRDREANKGDLHPPFASTCVRLWRHISGNPLHGASQCVRIPLLSPPLSSALYLLSKRTPQQTSWLSFCNASSGILICPGHDQRWAQQFSSLLRSCRC